MENVFCYLNFQLYQTLKKKKKIQCVFGYQWKIKIILPFNLFLLLLMGLTTLFDTIYGLRCIILTNFYLYLQYFQQ